VKRPKLTPGGSVSVGAAGGTLARLAFRARHRQAGNRDCLAPQGLPVVLDLEGSTRATWATTGSFSGARTDP
jgi:hypothetical protein